MKQEPKKAPHLLECNDEDEYYDEEDEEEDANMLEKKNDAGEGDQKLAAPLV